MNTFCFLAFLAVACVCVTDGATCPASPPISCPTNDCVCANVKPYVGCKEVTAARSLNCKWKRNLNTLADIEILGGKIVAYKIRWFNGSWSGWYVPGWNDVDHKYSTSKLYCSGVTYPTNTLRRFWSYFYDHTHKYILCKGM